MEAVGRMVTFAAAWLAAAVLAVAVAWQGVGIVTRQVTDDRPAPLSAADLRARAVGPSPSSTLPSSPGSTVASPTTAAPSVTTAPVVTTAPPVVTTAPPPTTTTSTTAPPSQPAAETRTYNLVGGSASLRFSAEGVTVLWANPAAGFEVEIEPEHVNGVKVEFESETHRSRVDGWWDDGPQDRVREEDR
jgi:hypothetical protein